MSGITAIQLTLINSHTGARILLMCLHVSLKGLGYGECENDNKLFTFSLTSNRANTEQREGSVDALWVVLIQCTLHWCRSKLFVGRAVVA
jgi:hypothetical protein